MVRKFINHLKDFCANCTLSGLAYIANPNLHITERVFWLVCVVLSAIGSYLLINQFQQDFDSKAVSIVYESIHPSEKITFPPISVCEIEDKNDFPEKVEEYVKSLGDKDAKYNYDVEKHLFFLMYPYTYHQGMGKKQCSPYENCENCIKCPPDGFRNIITELTANCSELFLNCSLSEKPFDCCKYFLPLMTPFGKCFFVNSLLNNKPGSDTWMNTIIDPVVDAPVMQLTTRKSIQVTIQNSEDLPNNVVPGVSITLTHPGYKSIQVYVENIVNDPDVREVSPQYRSCRFSDEILPYSVYKAYSFSTCIADCVRLHQMRVCNCSLPILLPHEHETIRECGLEGYLCLETFELIKPDSKVLLPWANKNFTCECLPSCTEHDIRSIYESKAVMNQKDNYRRATINMPVLPTERYRRQALRTRLDVVVTIGGILGLFMGASLLSAIEILYYFTLRLYINIKSA